jgi:COP9 signalosome complex subunit 1
MEGMYAEYPDVYGDMEGVVGGAGPSGSSVDPPKPPKKNVIVDEQHPFDLEAYIASYTGERNPLILFSYSFNELFSGQAAIKRLRFIASNSTTLQGAALRLAIDQTKAVNLDASLYQQLVNEYNALPSVHTQIPLDYDWMAKVKATKDTEGDRLQIELKTYTTNLIKESTRVRSCTSL